MNSRRRAVVSPKALKVAAAVVVGLSVGTLVSSDPVALPVVGTASGLLVGGVGLLAGGVLYYWVPGLVASPDCGCSGDCGCS